MKKITIIGGGGFGWAWAFLFAWAGYDVTILVRELKLPTGCEYPYDWMLQYSKPQNILVKQLSAKHSVDQDELIFIATPASAIHVVVEMLMEWGRNSIENSFKIVTLTKGICGGLPPYEVIAHRLPEARLAHITGAAFSENLVRLISNGQWMHMVVASKDKALLAELEDILKSAKIKPVASSDPVSVQLGFAIRPVVSFMQGMALGYVEAHPELELELLLHLVFSKMEYEGMRIAERLGADPYTLTNCEIEPVLRADHWLCCSNDSRNFLEGRKFGAGGPVRLLTERGVVEAINSIQFVHERLWCMVPYDYAQTTQYICQSFPYVSEVYACLFQSKSLDESVQAILARF